MPRTTKSIKLEVFLLHCREGVAEFDYDDAFARISRARSSTRQLEDREKLLALPSFHFYRSRKLVEFTAYEGPVGVNPLIFDAATGRERYESLTGSQVVATRTYGLIDLRSREAIIEYNHRGAKAHDIASLLEETGRKVGLGSDFAVELTPRVDDTFLAALAKFGRIKVANMKVVRPNYDWTDNYEGLNQVGDQSNGRAVELTVTAHRNDSLAKQVGIIQYIREMIGEGVSSLKGAKVVGIRRGETAETTISLANHVVHQKTYVRIDANGHALREDIQERLREFQRSRKEARTG